MSTTQHATSSRSGKSSSAKSGDRTVRVNVRLVLCCLAVLTVLAGVVYWVHGLQVHRQASTLLTQADKAHEAGRLQEEIGYLGSYVHFRPEDTAALARLGERLFEQAHATGDVRALHGASARFEEVLRRDPKRESIRRLQVEASLGLGRYEDALHHLSVLVPRRRQELADRLKQPAPAESAGRTTEELRHELAELMSFAARCHHVTKSEAHAVNLYFQALLLEDERVEDYQRLASLVLTRSENLPPRARLLSGLPPEFAVPQSLLPEEAGPFAETLTNLFPEEGRPVIPDHLVELLYREMVERGRPRHRALMARALYRTNRIETVDALPMELEAATRRAERLMHDFDADENQALETAEWLHVAVVPPTADLDGDTRITLEELVARYQAGAERARLAQAEPDIQAALETVDAENRADVLLAAADHAAAQAEAARQAGLSEEAEGRLKTAERLAREGLKARPEEARFYLVLSRIAQQSVPGDASPQERLTACTAAETPLREGIVERDQQRVDNPGPSNADGFELDWQLANLLITQAQLLEHELNRKQTAQKKLAEAERLIQHLSATEVPPGLATYLEGRQALVNRQWSVAGLKLEQSRPHLLRRPQLRRQLDLSLRFVYQRLNNPDARRELFRRAQKDDPLWVAGRWELARALVAVNRLEEALTEYQLIAGIPEIAVEAARVMLLKELTRPAEQRRWGPVESLLDSVAESSPDLVEAALLRSLLFVARKDYRRAEDLLEQTRSRHPEEASVRTALFRLALGRDDQEPAARLYNAEEILYEAQQELDDSAGLRALAVELALHRPADQAEIALSSIEADVQSESTGLEPDERIAVLKLLAEAFLRIEQPETAHSLWEQIARERPDDLFVRLTLVRQAFADEDLDAARRLLVEVRRIEGSSGPNGNVIEAALELDAIQRNSRLRQAPAELAAALERPKQLLEEAARSRPSWFAVAQLQGDLDWMQGRFEQAAAHYRRAITQGSRSKDAVQRAVSFLQSQKRHEEADQVIETIAEDAPELVAKDLAWLAVAVDLNQQQWDQALPRARQSADSGDYRDKILAAHVLYSRYQSLPRAERLEPPGQALLTEAETLYRNALEEVPANADAWMAYVTHLTRTGRMEAAREAIDEARRKLPAEPQHVHLMTLARLYELVLSPKEAEAHYLKALEDNPQDLAAQRSIAEFYIRSGRPAQAEPFLDRLLDHSSQAVRDWARQRKALVLAARGTYKDAEEALQL
ncbi:MAG: tetratricopeptide repeat protein, partial [Planctomycetaceae bacterium]